MATFKKIKSLFPFLGILVIIPTIAWNPQEDNFTSYSQEIPDSDVSFNLVPIPGGKFQMGSMQMEDEGPVQEVEISPFWMGAHEITWDIFELFLDKDYEASIADKPLPEGVDGLTRPSIPYLDMTFGMGKERMPAIGMTQYGAIQFCKWLYLKTGIFYRLPTEAEWEYAARAGSSDKYFFGNDVSQLEEYAWFAENSDQSTHKVGQKKPNPWGLYDILGNVMEWTSDQYFPESYQSRSNFLDPQVPNEKLYPSVIRGGHYQSPPEDLRVSKRFASTPVWKRIDPQIPKSQWWFPEAPFLGLRVVRPLKTPSEAEIWEYYNKAPIADY